jgi:hypothetical protein
MHYRPLLTTVALATALIPACLHGDHFVLAAVAGGTAHRLAIQMMTALTPLLHQVRVTLLMTGDTLSFFEFTAWKFCRNNTTAEKQQ